MEVYQDMWNLFAHPEDYADEDQDIVIGKYDSGTYLMIGIDVASGKFYFEWEDENQSECYYQEDGETLESTWERMIEDLDMLSGKY